MNEKQFKFCIEKLDRAIKDYESDDKAFANREVMVELRAFMYQYKKCIEKVFALYNGYIENSEYFLELDDSKHAEHIQECIRLICGSFRYGDLEDAADHLEDAKSCIDTEFDHYNELKKLIESK